MRPLAGDLGCSLSFSRVIFFVLSVSQVFLVIRFALLWKSSFGELCARRFLKVLCHCIYRWEKVFPCVLATNKECFFVCFLVSGVVHFPAKGVIIVPYCYFATCIIERSLMYKRELFQKIWGQPAFEIVYNIIFYKIFYEKSIFDFFINCEKTALQTFFLLCKDVLW